ncbi:MAG: VIT domain-containing protein [Myxococcota bacterium]
MPTDPHTDAVPQTGGTLVSTGGRALPLRSARLTGRLCAGVGRVALSQTFHNPHAEPLSVTYQLPLPHDGAVSGFSFRIGEREIVGEIDRKAAARERYESAIAEGRSAAHLEQERGSLFTQEVGNIPPGATVVARVEIDQPLVWVSDAGPDAGGWEWRFPTVVAPRYMGTAGRVPDADRFSVTVSDRPRPVTMELDVVVADAILPGRAPESPSHALLPGRGGHIAFANDSVGLDRDVVVRWPVATPQIALSVDAGCLHSGPGDVQELYGLVTVVPPAARGAAVVPRDLVVLLDTSGSMGGEPLAQAQRVAAALVDGLRDTDTLELIEFSSRPRRFGRGAEAADATTKAKAQQWIASLRAGGGTEMVSGILEALRGVRAEAQRQVVVITDGLIGFERDVLAAIEEQLPAASRVHTVGVGSSVNRSLTGPAARAGRGVEVVIGIGEDPERATRRLLRRTEDPLVVDLVIEGQGLLEHAPARLPDLYAGSPALIPIRLAPNGGALRLRGRTASGTWEARTEVRRPVDRRGNGAVASLFGREKVEDLELAAAAGGDANDAAIEALGLHFSIATRMTSWVAVSDRLDVDPRDPTRREEVPQEVPYGMSVEGLGLRAAAPMAPQGRARVRRAAPAAKSESITQAGSLPGAFERSAYGPGSGDAFKGGGGAAAKPKKKRGRGGLGRRILRRLEEKLTDKADEAERAPLPPAAAAPPRPQAADPVSVSGERDLDDEGFAEESVAEAPREDATLLPLQGRITRRFDENWFIEFALPVGQGWPAGVTTLELADGTRLAGSITTIEKRPPRADGTVIVALVFVAEREVDGTAVVLHLSIDGVATPVQLVTEASVTTTP